MAKEQSEHRNRACSVLDFGILRWREQGGEQVEPRNEHKYSFRGCGDHRDGQNPEIEHKHAQFRGCKVARQEEGPKRAQMLISGVVVVAAGRGWAKPQK